MSMNKADFVERVDSIIGFLEPLRAFLDLKPRHYLTGSAFESLPSHIQKELQDMSPEEIRTLSWMQERAETDRKGLDAIRTATRRWAARCMPPPQEPLAEPIRLSKAAAVGMTPKKRHETEMLAPLVAQAAGLASPEPMAILDVGCGHGYLTMACGLLCGLPMVGVEGKYLLSDKRVINRCQVMLKESTHPQPRQPVFAKVAFDSKTTIREQVEIGTNSSIGLVGLHACGQLSVDMIRMFSQDPKASMLTLVSCCYGRFGALGNAMEFPMSRCCRERGLRLSEAALRTASESLAERQQESVEEYERSHTLLLYRLASECILDRELGGAENYKCMKGVAKKTVGSFAEYFGLLRQNMVSNRQLRPISDDELIQTYGELVPDRVRHKILAMLGLKYSLGDLLESLVIFDRAVFLYEQGARQVDVFSCFDETISPTNLCLRALKDSVY